MSCVVTSLSFLFLLASIGAEALSFLTSYMILNRIEPGLHDGLFQRCGAMSYFQAAVNSVGSFVSKATDGSLALKDSCAWWTPRTFETDEASMKAVIILAFVSGGILALTFLFFLISLIERFKTRSLHIFLGILMMINGVVLAAIIVAYTLLYAKDVRMNPTPNKALIFSWSYWVLYGAAAGNLFTAILFCCNPARSFSD